ncbi:MAG: hypothetical protein Q7K57_57340 [Burkholderiaceae bacterium]|nr:hypothetical protein [Burkholderiaceae bacterium]
MNSRIATQTRAFAHTPTGIDLAWASGFADGEACIHIARQIYVDPARRDTFRMRFAITQNHLAVLREFERSVAVVGRIYQLKRDDSQNRDCFQLVYDGDLAFTVIERIAPYLRRKQHEAKAALAFRTICHINRRFGRNGCPAEIWKLREGYYRKLQALK